MKTKKLAALLSAAAMAVTSLSITAFATGGGSAAVPVEVNDFAGLKTALAADPAPTEIIAKGQIVVDTDIDLKGATLKAAPATDYNTARNGMVYIDGDVKVSNGTIDGNDMDYTLNGNNGYYVVNIKDGHTSVTFENMKVQSGKPSDNQEGTNFTKSSIINVGTKLTLKNCTVTTSGKSAALKADDAGIIIDGGKVDAYYPIMMWEDVTIKGGAEVKATGGKNAVQIGVWNGYNDTTKAKLNIEDATIDGAVSILSKQTGVWPTINVGAEATLKNFDVVASDAYQGTAFDTMADIEADFNIDEEATVEFAEDADPDSKYLSKVAEDNEIVVVPGGEALRGYTDLGSWEKSADIDLTGAKKGDKIIIEFNKIDTGAQIKIGVGADGVLLDTKDIAAADLTDKKFVYELTEENAATIAAKGTGGYVGGQNAIIKVTFEAKQAETVKAEAKKPVVITPAETALDDTKGNSIALKSGDKIVELKAGNVIAVEYKDAKDFPYGAYFAVNNGGKSIAGWEVTQPLFTKAAGTVTYTVSAADITALGDYKANGLTMSGNKVTVTKITVYATKAEADEALKTETTPENNGSSNPGYVVITPNDTTAASDAAASAETTADTAAATTANGSASEGDKNQATGVVLAVIPAMLAAAGVVASKKRK